MTDDYFEICSINVQRFWFVERNLLIKLLIVYRHVCRLRLFVTDKRIAIKKNQLPAASTFVIKVIVEFLFYASVNFPTKRFATETRRDLALTTA